jgi:class 3 adenylate cyclase
LDFGALNGCDRLLHASPCYSVRATGMRELNIKIADGRYRPGVGQLAAGKVTLRLENAGSARAALMMIFLPIKYIGSAAAFEPFLSGNRVLSTQTFRDLFRSEVIRGTQGLSVRDISVLFTDLKGSTALYDRIGDLKAFELVQRHFDAVAKVIQKHSGALVKTIGDAVMATFLSPVQAAHAAVEMLEEIETFNQGGKDLMLKIGIHRGASIAVTLNDRLDYFGQTVNIAARVQGLADAEQIYVTHEVFSQPGVPEAFQGFQVAPERAQLRGVQDEMQVYKIARP